MRHATGKKIVNKQFSPGNKHICTYTHMHICTYTHMHICTYAHMHICTYAHMHICTYAHMHICTYAHMHIFTYSHIHIYTYTHIHISVIKSLKKLLHMLSSYIPTRYGVPMFSNRVRFVPPSHVSSSVHHCDKSS